MHRSSESFSSLVDALRAGKVVAMACDTIYGLVGRSPDTEAAIRAIKGRGETAPFIRLLAVETALSKWVDVEEYSDILSLWPGPFTLVFPTIAGGTAAFRVPQDDRLRTLINDVGAPLFSTSVNRSGSPALDNPRDIEKEFGKELALVEDSGVFNRRMPSTVVDVSTRPYRILRQGAGSVPDGLLKAF